MPHNPPRTSNAPPPEGADYETVAVSLRPPSWRIVLISIGIVAACGIARFATASRNEWVTDNRAVGGLFVGGVIILLVVVFQMRRQLGNQLAGAVQTKRIIEAQNRDLRDHASVLEIQTAQLRNQAAELESQRSHLEDQTIELETALDELRQAERHQHALADEARRLNRRLKEGQRVAQLGYWEIDAQTGDVFWSDEMYRFCGQEPGMGPAPTDHYLECVHPEDRQRMQETTAEAVLNLHEFTEQYRISANGKTYIVQAIGRILVDEDGKRKLVGTVQDITERVQLESQLRQSQKMDAVGRLAGGVAHDFNNMLTAVGGYGQLLRDATPENPELHPLIDGVLSATRRASELTQQLLAFSRGRVLQPRVLDVRESVRGDESLLSRLIGEDVELVLRLDADAPLVLADPTQITQVLLNLVVNARDAMPGGGRLVIDTGTVTLSETGTVQYPGMRPGVHAVISVSDTGTGMSAETQARIFEPFFTTKPEGQGTGLGLSTVFGIVQQSGGGIWVISEPGRGTTFTVYLPECLGQANSTPAVESIKAAPRTLQATVLVVEDDETVRQVSRMILEQRGYVVKEAKNGIEALDVLDRVDVDVVVTDTVMPKMGGRELAGRLAAEHPGLPVILASGYTADALQREGPMPDLLLFLQKPFDPETLDTTVQEALGRAPAGVR